MAPGRELPESDPRRAQFPAAFRTRSLRGSEGGVSATVFKQLSRERRDLARLQPEAVSESGDLTIRDLTPPSAPLRPAAGTPGAGPAVLPIGRGVCMGGVGGTGSGAVEERALSGWPSVRGGSLLLGVKGESGGLPEPAPAG